MENETEAHKDKGELTGIDPDIKEMIEAGVHFGHRKTSQHPKMLPYVFGVRNAVSIIDLEKTRENLSEAITYMSGIAEEGKTILFVDTRPSTRKETKKIAEELGAPHVTERWSGGTITNWKTILDRIAHLKDLEEKAESSEWEKYTKKERSDMKGEIKKLNILWGGIKNMNALPAAIFVVDMKENALAAREARIKNISVVAICDTNIDPTKADYPIPANDDALSSVRYILGHVKDGILKSRKKS